MFILQVNRQNVTSNQTPEDVMDMMQIQPHAAASAPVADSALAPEASAALEESGAENKIKLAV
jgi:hypothetical protein